MKQIISRFKKTYLTRSETITLVIGVKAYLTYDETGEVMVKTLSDGRLFTPRILSKTDVHNFISTFKMIESDTLYYFVINNETFLWTLVDKEPKLFLKLNVQNESIISAAYKLGYNLKPLKIKMISEL
jgi:hypothetical protein